MNSQNHYHLTFNPRGPRQVRPQPQLRYVPTLKPHQPQPYRSPPHHPPQYTQPPIDHSHLPSSPSEHHDTSYTSHSSSRSLSRREEAKQRQRQKQAQIMRRVRDLQQRVMPLVGGDDQQELDVGWQSRVQLKLLRIESQLQAYRKEWQLQMQRKLTQLDNNWQQQFDLMIKR